MNTLQRVCIPNPKSKNNSGQPLATMSGYSAGGKIGHLQYGNSASTQYDYDSSSQRLVAINAYDATGIPIMNREYWYTPMADIQQINDGMENVSYFYDYDQRH